MKQKVLAYITRRHTGGRAELLVFDHVDFPEAGTQVPAGTVEPGEPPEQAVLREVLEETGLSGLRTVRYAGCFPYRREDRQELHQRHVYVLEADRPLPDSWEHVVSSGTEDQGLRFRCYWADAKEAAGFLAGNQGDYLEAAFGRMRR